MRVIKLLECINYDRHSIDDDVATHGKRLAEVLMTNVVSNEPFQIDLEAPPGLLINSFFTTLFQALDDAERFDIVDKIEWVTRYDFQKRNIELFLQMYQSNRESKRRIKNIINNLDTQKDWTLDDYRDFYDRDVKFLLKSFVPHLLPAEEPCEANS